ncbi:hemerythrin domain-containing protein [Pseudomarimonas arenosa]|uniref:Hemerythrin domain-containing protein n=1 Tax=Pseudomarimonas arenosa TaxID=2774145 RepID=A0AAW3ZQR9_9GAMM|nr:hemerythrin domain-containing protein [Pseudomarimonas arenosa]MBD8527457.1 hemerythrin domain-containing protein [Pseudomarimonas arenosa]
MDMRQFTEDHRSILALVEQIRCDLDAEPAHSPESLLPRLHRLCSKLSLHLAIEDDFLYPHLMDLRHSPAALLAERFRREVGGLRQELDAFADRFASARDIRREPEEFRCECARLIEALCNRIQREEEDLYPLAGDV